MRCSQNTGVVYFCLYFYLFLYRRSSRCMEEGGQVGDHPKDEQRHSGITTRSPWIGGGVLPKWAKSQCSGSRSAFPQGTFQHKIFPGVPPKTLPLLPHHPILSSWCKEFAEAQSSFSIVLCLFREKRDFEEFLSQSSDTGIVFSMFQIGICLRLKVSKKTGTHWDCPNILPLCDGVDYLLSCIWAPNK